MTQLVVDVVSENRRYRAKRELHFAFGIWQASFVNHRIHDAEDYERHHSYIWQNPVRAGLGDRPEFFVWSSAL